jgi:hypothetical protein
MLYVGMIGYYPYYVHRALVLSVEDVIPYHYYYYYYCSIIYSIV